MADRIQRQIDLPATPDQVWEKLTSAGALEGWLADEVWLELVPGGEARFRDGERFSDGWVEEVLPPGRGQAGEVAARLAFWWSEADQPASRVELTLTALERGTRVRVVETRPLELIDVIGIPLPGTGGRSFGPALAAAGR